LARAISGSGTFGFWANSPKSVENSIYFVAAKRKDAVRVCADHGNAGASFALAAKMADCSQRRLVFMLHPFALPAFWRACAELPKFKATVCRQKGNI
jgi:hypothetical protein